MARNGLSAVCSSAPGNGSTAQRAFTATSITTTIHVSATADRSPDAASMPTGVVIVAGKTTSAATSIMTRPVTITATTMANTRTMTTTATARATGTVMTTT